MPSEWESLSWSSQHHCVLSFKQFSLIELFIMWFLLIWNTFPDHVREALLLFSVYIFLQCIEGKIFLHQSVWQKYQPHQPLSFIYVLQLFFLLFSSLHFYAAIFYYSIHFYVAKLYFLCNFVFMRFQCILAEAQFYSGPI